MEGFSLLELLMSLLISSIVLMGVISLYSCVHRLWLTQIQVAHRQEDIRGAYFVIKEQVKTFPCFLKVHHQSLYYYQHRWLVLAEGVSEVRLSYGVCQDHHCEFRDRSMIQEGQEIACVRVEIDWQISARKTVSTRWYYAV